MTIEVAERTVAEFRAELEELCTKYGYTFTTCRDGIEVRRGEWPVLEVITVNIAPDGDVSTSFVE